jgi:AcrR family transcriptional regulator
MDQMAGAAGVTKPNLYWFFGDKGGLYEAIAQRCVRLVGDEVRGAVAGGSDPRGTLLVGIEAYLRFVQSEPNIYRFLMQQPRFVRQLSHELGVLVGDRLAAAGRETGGEEIFGHGIVGMINSTADWWVDQPEVSRASLVSYLTDLLWDGLARSPSVHEVVDAAKGQP